MAELFVMHHSTCARKALFVMLEKDIYDGGTDLESREVAREYLRTAEYRAMNPDGLVPTLKTSSGDVLVASSVIMRYIDDVYGSKPSMLQPSDPLERARMNLWMKLVDEKYFPALQAFTIAVFMRRMFGSPLDEARLRAMLDSLTDYGLRVMREDAIRKGPESPWVTEGLATVRAMLDRMDDALAKHEWVVGSAMTLADCALVPIVLRLEEFGLADAWSTRPSLARWWSAMRSRPSVSRLVAIADQALLKELITSIGDARPRYLLSLAQGPALSD